VARDTTVHMRYEVGEPIEGSLAHFQTWEKAVEYANRIQADSVTIFDLMAHRGRPQLWDCHGTVLEIRASK
jgi:hypothetical protein